jgi:hypothetical protein
VSDTGSYNAPGAGVYRAQLCFRSDDGIDSQVSYSQLVVTS